MSTLLMKNVTFDIDYRDTVDNGQVMSFEAAAWHLLQHFLSSTFASDFGWKMVLLTHFQSPTDTSFIVLIRQPKKNLWRYFAGPRPSLPSTYLCVCPPLPFWWLSWWSIKYDQNSYILQMGGSHQVECCIFPLHSISSFMWNIFQDNALVFQMAQTRHQYLF